MSTTPPTRKRSRPRSGPDRRAAPAAEGAPVTLRRLKGMLGQPIRFERRDGHLHMVLVDRRRAPLVEPPPLPELQAELRTRLSAHQREHADQPLRQLTYVHDELGRSGWAGVGALSGDLLGRALLQAEALAGAQRSPLWTAIVGQLQRLHVAADQREVREARLAGPGIGADLEVSEATHEEFEASERSWVGTRPLGLVWLDRKR